MSEFVGYFLTWTTYGTWLPGDSRGWRSRRGGSQFPDLELELECAAKLSASPVLPRPQDRPVVEDAIREHCLVRAWELHAVNARSNHVHVVVAAYEKPKTVRDQLKANCTRCLRTGLDPLIREKTWANGGDCRVLDDEDDLESAIQYVLDAQD